MSYRSDLPAVDRLRLLAEHDPNHYNAASCFTALEFSEVLKNSDGLVVTRGIFTLPLPAMDAPSEPDRSGVQQPYIAGPENELLRVFLDAISTLPVAFNPITLYGPSGVGKSHLVYGAVNYLRSEAADRNVTDRKVSAMSGADFSRWYARSVELDSLAELHERLLTTDVFMIDGLQELATKRAAQQELLNCVDGALERGTLLLLTCNAPPAEWTWMLPALRSRLIGGLILSVVYPQLQTRIEMARHLATQLGVSLSDETIHDLSAGQTGSLAAPIMYSQLRGLLMQRASQSFESPLLGSGAISRESDEHGSPSVEKTARRIAKVVAQHFDLNLTDLLGASRRHSVVRARGVAMYLARSLLALSYEQLGQTFGGRDHTTVMHAYRKTVNSLSTDHILKQTVDRITTQLATTVTA